MDLSNLQNIIQENKEHELEAEASKKEDLHYLDLRETIIKVTQALIEFQESHTTTTIVANQPKSISTPDVEGTTRAVEGLHETILRQEPVDIQPLVEKMSDAISELQKLPKEYPELKLPERVDYTKNINELDKRLKEVVDSISKIELKAPDVNVAAPEINLEAPDLEPLLEQSKNLEKAIKAIKIPVPDKIDLSKVEKELKAQTKLLTDIREVSSGGGSGGGGTIAPFLINGALPVVSSGGVTYITVLREKAGDPQIVYVGKALPGTATSANTWQVASLDKSTKLDLLYADGGAFTQVYDDRESLTYA